MKQPPALAKWLLTRLAPSASDSLLGDLAEEYTSGRSQPWYWRQTLNIVGAATSGRARSHPVLTLRAVTLGWVFLWMFYEYLLHPMADLDHALFVRGVMDVRGWWPHSPAMLLLVSFLGWVASGWLVTRFHDRQLLLVFLGSIFLWHITILPGIADGNVGRPTIEKVINLTLQFGVIAVSILIGGLCVEPRRALSASKVSG